MRSEPRSEPVSAAARPVREDAERAASRPGGRELACVTFSAQKIISALLICNARHRLLRTLQNYVCRAVPAAPPGFATFLPKKFSWPLVYVTRVIACLGTLQNCVCRAV